MLWNRDDDTRKGLAPIVTWVARRIYDCDISAVVMMTTICEYFEKQTRLQITRSVTTDELRDVERLEAAGCQDSAPVLIY